MIQDFSFHHSFQEVAARTKAICTCGADHRAEEKGRASHPSAHLDGCPVSVLYRLWTATATSTWNDRLRHVPTRSRVVEE